MAFKMPLGKISIDNTPIYEINEEEGVLGRANKNGSITLNKNLSPLEREDVIRHEKVHLEQMGCKKIVKVSIEMIYITMMNLFTGKVKNIQDQ